MANELDISSTTTDVPHRRGGKSRNIFNRLRLRSRSVANLKTEKPSGSYFSSWFSRKPPTPSPQHQATDSTTTKRIRGDAEEEGEQEIESSQLKIVNGGPKTTRAFKTSTNNNIENGLTSVHIGDCDRQLSASHSNLQSTKYHPEMNGRIDEAHGLASNAGTSRMPSYVNISLVANGYSRSRTNLHTVLSRSGDVHNLIVDGTDVTDVNPEHKAVIFVNDAMKKLPSPSTFSFIIPELEVIDESPGNFQRLAETLQTTLSKCIEHSDAILSRTNIPEEARESILVASGHTRVLLKSKVKKMLQLIDKHRETNGETVTLNDLASFWEMMDIDVTKIREHFNVVEKFRLNYWKPLPEDAITPTVTPLQTPRATPKPKSTNKIIVQKSETPRAANSTPRTSRPNVKEFLAARRKEMADKPKLENGHSNDIALVTTQ